MDPISSQCGDNSVEIFLYKDAGRETFQYITVEPGEKFTLPDGYCSGGARLEFPGIEFDAFEYRLECGATYSVERNRIMKYLPGGVELTEFFPREHGTIQPLVRFSVGRYVYDDEGALVPDTSAPGRGYTDTCGHIVIPAG